MDPDNYWVSHAWRLMDLRPFGGESCAVLARQEGGEG